MSRIRIQMRGAAQKMRHASLQNEAPCPAARRRGSRGVGRGAGDAAVLGRISMRRLRGARRRAIVPQVEAAREGSVTRGCKRGPGLPCAVDAVTPVVVAASPGDLKPMTDPVLREPAGVVRARRTVEGGGFVVRRPFPTPEMAMFDPFLLLDEMGPVEYAPGKAVGAPDHPHRGFETVTY